MTGRNRGGSLLLCCAGLGMGNASRMAAVIEQLAVDPQDSLIVASWGRGEEYLREFKRKSKCTFTFLSLLPYKAPSNMFRILRPAHFAYVYLCNSVRLFLVALSVRPHSVLLDSDYHFFPFLLLGTRILFLGQTGFVLDAQRRVRLPFSIREKAIFFFRERMDFLVQRLFSNRVLAPVISFEFPNNRKYTPVPPVVRAGITHLGSHGNFTHEFSVILSGSGIQSSSLERFAEEKSIPILRAIPINREQLGSSRYFFIQGGFSSISEMLACGKKFVVVPMQDHPEQKINAEIVRRSGRGLVLDAHMLQGLNMNALRKKLSALPDAPAFERRGAEVVAKILCNAYC